MGDDTRRSKSPSPQSLEKRKLEKQPNSPSKMVYDGSKSHSEISAKLPIEQFGTLGKVAEMSYGIMGKSSEMGRNYQQQEDTLSSQRDTHSVTKKDACYKLISEAELKTRATSIINRAFSKCTSTHGKLNLHFSQLFHEDLNEKTKNLLYKIRGLTNHTNNVLNSYKDIYLSDSKKKPSLISQLGNIRNSIEQNNIENSYGVFVRYFGNYMHHDIKIYNSWKGCVDELKAIKSELHNCHKDNSIEFHTSLEKYYKETEIQVNILNSASELIRSVFRPTILDHLDSEIADSPHFTPEEIQNDIKRKLTQKIKDYQEAITALLKSKNKEDTASIESKQVKIFLPIIPLLSNNLETEQSSKEPLSKFEHSPKRARFSE
jgi:hypothetical protein